MRVRTGYAKLSYWISCQPDLSYKCSSAMTHRSTKTTTLFLTLALLCLAATAFAQREKYVLGVGDKLSLLIYAGGESQLPGGALTQTISEEGTITLPFLGIVRAKGLTVEQLTKEIADRLEADYFVDPQVVLSVVEYRSRRVYILGEVNKPGPYGMEGEARTLLELISMAGGVTDRSGSQAFVLRGAYEDVASGGEINELVAQKEPIKADLQQLLEKGDPTSNVKLQPDDVVYIPAGVLTARARSKIYVMGKVKRPGLYEYEEGMTALSACLLAGGFDKFAAPNRTTITRFENGEKTIIKINLDDVKHSKTDDLPLRPGDRIYIPKSWL